MSDGSQDRPILEIKAVLEQLGGDLDLLAEVAQIAIDGTADMLSAVREAVDRRDAGAVAQAAHRLKGSFVTIAAGAAADAAFRLERMGRGGDLGQAGTAFADLQQEVQRLLPELEKLAARGGPAAIS